ncbi:two-component system chemotaxis sensor kinase CheA [Caldicoprobacter guelmensis]|uniref:chemotaxis protein CheA n=1 Tax=Caldicoprobacter guelmensis TaxID=1170224 RepID=UPI00195D7691|nr:chemotaxis protein CheA [Caldicoprobacter guelmensis]MBM7582894.1 two-component system chemotaxis sensor kinase CheA [Caldicoprobacter guelmensis]
MSDIFENLEIINLFIGEMEEQILLFENGIVELEKDINNPEIVQKLFRAAHTLKGSSAAVGFEQMKVLTHEMENVLDRIRNHMLKVSRPVVDVLLECLDCLKALKDEFVVDRYCINTDIRPIMAKLQGILAGSSDVYAAEEAERADVRQKLFALDAKQEEQVKQAVEIGQNVWVCQVEIAKDCQMKLARAYTVKNFLNERGTVIGMVPDAIDVRDEEIDKVCFLVITQMGADELEYEVRNGLVDVEEVNVFPYSFNSPEIMKLSENEGKSLCSDLNGSMNAKGADETKRMSGRTVRIEVERLERMMDLVGELVIEQIRIAQAGNDLHNKYPTDETVDDLISISNHVSVLIDELQEAIMKTRMIPVQQLFNRFPRIVRDLTRSLNKEVELILEGGETEIDRTIVEDITDPLIHLIRNAVDHGIESPEVRKRLGKPEKGMLRISALPKDSNVIITVEDDGAGIDLEEIKRMAIERRIISKEEANTMTHEQLVNLIFQPGFSTSNEVNDISGRGVGMDIVKNCVEKLKGVIDVETYAGAGTKFVIKLPIKLPMTLAILKGLLVKIGNETYAIPMNNVIEIVRQPRKAIEFVNGQAVTVIRNKAIPLVWLHDYFGIPRVKERKNILIVLLGMAEKRLGLVVDELIGNQEVVVTNLGAYIGKVEGISGATILGDRSVACILDVAGIMKMVSERKIKKDSNHELIAVNE